MCIRCFMFFHESNFFSRGFFAHTRGIYCNSDKPSTRKRGKFFFFSGTVSNKPDLSRLKISKSRCFRFHRYNRRLWSGNLFRGAFYTPFLALSADQTDLTKKALGLPPTPIAHKITSTSTVHRHMYFVRRAVVIHGGHEN